MRTRHKILLDRVAAQPLALGANAAARLLGAVMRRDHSLDPERVRTVVVAKFVGMGSILQATPLLRGLRDRFPHARIVFVTAAANRALLEMLTGVDEAIYVDDRSPSAVTASTLRAVARLARRRVDLYLDLEIYSAYACLVALASLARLRLGFYRSSAHFKAGIYTHLVYFNTQRPVRELYLQLGRAVGVDDPASADGREVSLGPLRVPETARRSLDVTWRRLAGARADQAPVVVNPNASDLLEERRWPAAQCRRALEMLVTKGHLVALTGAPDEREYVEGLRASLAPGTRAGVVSTAGELALPELMALLERAACVITNDSGPMHMAIALERPTVCLFGPCDPGHYGTPRPDVAILYRPVLCSPCVHHTERPPCAGDNVCMQRIEPEAVVRAAEDLMAGRPAAGAETLRAEPAALRNAGGAALGLVVRESVLAGHPPCQACGAPGMRFLFRRFEMPFAACLRCGMQRIEGVAREDLSRYDRGYYDAWGLREDPETASRAKQDTFRRHLRRIRPPLRPGARVLDCGAATGLFMETAEEHGLVPWGVEASSWAADRIAERFGSERVHCGDFAREGFPGRKPGSFDAVFMLDFLEHLDDPAAALAQARRLLVPGGLLFVTTPDVGSWSRRVLRSSWIHYKPEHLFYFSRGALRRLLERTGFVELRISGARKVLSLRYGRHQLERYPHPVLTRLLRGGERLIPAGLWERPFPVGLGEMEAQARADGDARGG